MLCVLMQSLLCIYKQLQIRPTFNCLSKSVLTPDWSNTDDCLEAIYVKIDAVSNPQVSVSETQGVSTDPPDVGSGVPVVLEFNRVGLVLTRHQTLSCDTTVCFLF